MAAAAPFAMIRVKFELENSTAPCSTAGEAYGVEHRDRPETRACAGCLMSGYGDGDHRLMRQSKNATNSLERTSVARVQSPTNALDARAFRIDAIASKGSL
jgi:hypothetical protein